MIHTAKGTIVNGENFNFVVTVGFPEGLRYAGAVVRLAQPWSVTVDGTDYDLTGCSFDGFLLTEESTARITDIATSVSGTELTSTASIEFEVEDGKIVAWPTGEVLEEIRVAIDGVALTASKTFDVQL